MRTLPRTSRKVPAITAACVLAATALVGGGAALASSHTTEARHSTEPHNIGLLTGEILDYYGATQDADGVYQASAHSRYAKDVASVLSQARHDLARVAHQHHARGARPAVVLDVDDTALLSLDYEVKNNYGYSSASWNDYVQKADRPAVFGVPQLVDYANKLGIEVFFLTGLSEGQRDAAVANLTKDGYDTKLDRDHLFVKDTENPPAYLAHCATATAWNCTTVQFKEGTRKHIESAGYDIVGSFGDQYSDLEGRYADKTYKLPNPTYFVG